MAATSRYITIETDASTRLGLGGQLSASQHGWPLDKAGNRNPLPNDVITSHRYNYGGGALQEESIHAKH